MLRRRRNQLFAALVLALPLMNLYLYLHRDDVISMTKSRTSVYARATINERGQESAALNEWIDVSMTTDDTSGGEATMNSQLNDTKKYSHKFNTLLCAEQSEVDAQISQISARKTSGKKRSANVAKATGDDHTTPPVTHPTGDANASNLMSEFTTVNDVTTYENTCLFSCYRRPRNVYNEAFLGHVHVYDSAQKSADDVTLIPTNSRTYHDDGYWVMEHKSGGVPQKYGHLKNTVAYFAPYWRDFKRSPNESCSSNMQKTNITQNYSIDLHVEQLIRGL